MGQVTIQARTARHDPRRYRLLLEAMAALAAASAAVRFLPFKRAIRADDLRTRTAGRGVEQLTAETSWAVRKASSLAPWRTVCIQQGIALQRLLRRRGVDAQLHYGVRQGDCGELTAHVWVTAGDAVVMGAADAPLFQPVATFP
jgi:hypothetical protein